MFFDEGADICLGVNRSDVVVVGVACCCGNVDGRAASVLSVTVLLDVLVVVLDIFLKGMLKSLTNGEVIPFPDPPLLLGLTEADLLLGVTSPPVLVGTGGDEL